MPPAADRSPSSLSSPLSGRRIISRIASPFTSKSRNIVDFCIEVDDPHKQHSPGDVVHGSVRLRVLNPTRVTHLVVCLHGFVQVYKNPGSPGEGFRGNSGYVGTGRGKKAGEYFGNGFASLFEDETVLCGDGRLADGSYQFNFELEFPDRDLPSSIDFERGTISYMITATITRPTTISPTMTCDHKVYFVERMDISPLYPPKSRTITLEAVSRRTRAKHQARKLVDPSERRSRRGDSTQHSEQNDTSTASSAPSGQTDADGPVSPAPSEISFDSLVSSNGRTSQPGSVKQLPGASDVGRVNASKSSLANRSISATVESLAGGCLRGDNVGIKVNVNHTKPVRSLYGVIVTLYRQARVDMHPAIPLGPVEKGKASKYEDYYPKSVTGLGGLSLSGAGSSHVFRKDLTQVMVPLFVDPVSLTAEITAKVRVPEEAFPTISNVPGAMISFKYYVEVVLDIQGKLSGQDRNLGNLGLSGAQPHLAGGLEGSDQSPAFAPFGSTVVDTAPIRRDKGVITCTFEVVVGTRDSERRKGKRKVEAVAEPQPQPQPHAQQANPEQQDGADDGAYWYDGAGADQDPGWYQQYQHPETYGRPVGYDYSGYEDPVYYRPPPVVPIPQMADESQLSEKERMQRAEARLLPSQPPGTESEQSGITPEEATAPYLPEEVGQHPQTPPASGRSAPSYGEVAGSSAAASVAGASQPSHVHATQQDTAAPIYEPPHLGASSQRTVRPIGDKQELERQRLRAEASAPPGADDEIERTDTGPENDEPSAPTVDEADEHLPDGFDSHADAAGSSGLPRYER